MIEKREVKKLECWHKFYTYHYSRLKLKEEMLKQANKKIKSLEQKLETLSNNWNFWKGRYSDKNFLKNQKLVREIIKEETKQLKQQLKKKDKEIERLQIVEDEFYSIQHDFVGLKQQLKECERDFEALNDIHEESIRESAKKVLDLMKENEKLKQQLKEYEKENERLRETASNWFEKHEILKQQLKEKKKEIERLQKKEAKIGFESLKIIKKINKQLKSFKKSVIKIVDERIEELKEELKNNEAFRKVRKRVEKGEFPKIGDSLVMVVESQIHAQIMELQQLKKRLEKEI